MKKFGKGRSILSKVGGGAKKGGDEAFEEQRARYEHMSALLANIEKDLRRQQKTEHFSEPLSLLAGSFVVFFDGEGNEGGHGSAFQNVAAEVSSAFAEYTKAQAQLLEVVQAYQSKWTSLKPRISERDKLFAEYDRCRKTFEAYQAKPPKEVSKQEQAQQRFENSKGQYEQANESMVDAIKVLWHNRFDEFDNSFAQMTKLQFDLFNRIASSYATLEGAKASTASHPLSSPVPARSTAAAPASDTPLPVSASPAAATASEVEEDDDVPNVDDPEAAAVLLEKARASLEDAEQQVKEAGVALEAVENEQVGVQTAATEAKEAAVAAQKRLEEAEAASAGELKEYEEERSRLTAALEQAEKAAQEAKAKAAKKASAVEGDKPKRKAEFDFEKTEEGELSFLEDDIIVVLKQFDDSEWWEGLNERSKETGLFPSNYTVAVKSESADSAETESDDVDVEALERQVTDTRLELEKLQAPENPALSDAQIAAKETSGTAADLDAKLDRIREQVASATAAVANAEATVAKRTARVEEAVANHERALALEKERKEEAARLEAERRRQEEEAEKERQRVAEQARIDAEEKAKREVEEKARQEAAEQAKLEAAEKARQEAAEQAKLEAAAAEASQKEQSETDDKISAAAAVLSMAEESMKDSDAVPNPIRVAQHDFEGAEAGELPFKVDDRIQVLEQFSDSEWWKGLNDRTKATGLFPSNFTEPLSEKAAPPAAEAAPSSGGEASAAPSKPKRKANFDFEGTDEGELPFQEGDVIEVLESYEDSEWWQGKNLRTGATGLFPSNFTE